MSDVDDPRIAFYGQDEPTMETRIAALESQLATITAERDALLRSGAAANTALTVAQEQEDVLAEAGEVKRLTELLAAERERLCAPISDTEWIINTVCIKTNNDPPQYTLFLTHDRVNEIIANRAVLTAPAQEAQKEKP